MDEDNNDISLASLGADDELDQIWNSLSHEEKINTLSGVGYEVNK